MAIVLEHRGVAAKEVGHGSIKLEFKGVPKLAAFTNSNWVCLPNGGKGPLSNRQSAFKLQKESPERAKLSTGFALKYMKLHNMDWWKLARG